MNSGKDDGIWHWEIGRIYMVWEMAWVEDNKI